MTRWRGRRRPAESIPPRLCLVRVPCTSADPQGIGQGGTLANLRGRIEKRGGRVVGAVALTGKPYSARSLSGFYRGAAW